MLTFAKWLLLAGNTTRDRQHPSHTLMSLVVVSLARWGQRAFLRPAVFVAFWVSAIGKVLGTACGGSCGLQAVCDGFTLAACKAGCSFHTHVAVGPSPLLLQQCFFASSRCGQADARFCAMYV